jgi:hypothetical protein
VSFEGSAHVEYIEQWPSAYFVLASILGTICNGVALCWFTKGDNYLLLYNLSPLALGILCVMDFQNFSYCLMVNLLMERTSIKFGYMTFGCLGLMVSGVIHGRIGVRAVWLQSQGNRRTGWGVCKAAYVQYLGMIFVGSAMAGVFTWFVMPYGFYDYWQIAFYLFPVAQIVFCAKCVTPKNCFIFHYNILMWLPTLIDPLFMRGWDYNFLN